MMRNLQSLSFPVILLLIAALTGCGGAAKTPPPIGTGNGNGNGGGSSFTLAVTLSGSGTVTSNPAGINCGPTCSAGFSAGSSVALSAAPAAGFTFTGWSGACSGSGACTILMNSNQAVTASFAPQQAGPFTLSVTVNGTGAIQSSPAGINCPTACSASFSGGTQVTLTAQAPTDGTWVFTGWSGACTGANTCTLTLNSNQAVTASFAQQPLLQVTVTGSGTVASTPAGINCGAGATACSAPFAGGSTVTLSATAASGFIFGSWSGCSSTSGTNCTVVMNGNQNVAVTFTAAQPTLTVTLAGTGSGTVTSSPPGINCGSTCSASFPSGTTVTLTATAAQGSTFAGFSGACSGSSCSITMNADAAVTATFNTSSGTAGIDKVSHIIFMLQENRGFDHYFGHLPNVDGTPATASNPCHAATTNTTDQCGWDGTTTIGANQSGTSNTLQPFHLKTMCIENPSPSWNESHVDWSLAHPTQAPATLDGFIWEAAGDAIAQNYQDVYGRRSMGYYDGNDLNYYYFMASTFATSDRWFSPVMSRTDPNRMYLLAGTSQGHAYPQSDDSGSLAGPLTAKTIFQLLDENGITWRVYSEHGASDLSMFTYGSTHNVACSSPAATSCYASIQQYVNDTNAGTLPQVAFIENGTGTINGQTFGNDEHPSISDTDYTNIQEGQRYVATLINALMTSPSWTDSVFILTYDEGGGFYDHVAPFAEPNPDGTPPLDLKTGDICNKGETNTVNCNFDTSGFRVPLIVVSPFTRPGYVSHTDMDYTAILKFIETRFALQPLTARDAAQPDMTEFFDFVNKPFATPPTPPAPAAPGACYFNQFP